ncbi:MAG: methyl-accepting chemotaxis protein [Alphaproteobacteria bacterium PA2]|nr:MAG: methyl-accepting chemotaxis protein [Alphaproteobacteria bacterium PA2]
MSFRIAQATKWFGYFLVAAILILCAISYAAMDQVRIGSTSYQSISDSKDLVADILPPPLYLVEADLAAQLIVAHPEAELTEASAKLAQLHKDYETRLAFWKETKPPAEIATLLFGASNDAAQKFWTTVETKLLPAARAGDTAAIAAAGAEIDAAYLAHRKAVDEMVPLLAANVDEQLAESKQAVLYSRILLIGAGVLISVIAYLGLQVLKGRIVVPIQGISKYMGELASGDYNKKVPYFDRDDEVGDMARSVEVFRVSAVERQDQRKEQDALRESAEADRRRHERELEQADQIRTEVVRQLADGLSQIANGHLTIRLQESFPQEYEQLRADFNDAVEALDNLIANIGMSTAGVDSGATEIAHAADDLARRTEQQAASLEETAAALDQLTATVRQTATGAQEARQFVAEARAGAHKSGEVVSQAVEAMGEIESSSKQITQIIGVIDEIAFQTNLLALNAGVEAARAGDAGRGFAVVASEVRALAQRSADAAKEIKGLIQASERHVGNGVNHVSETGKALSVIVEQVSRIDSLITDMAGSAQEQASALGEVNIAVNHMDQMTQQNAAMVEETTAAAHTMRSNANELSAQIGGFRTSSMGPVSRKPSGQASHHNEARSEPRAAAPRTMGALALKEDVDGWEEF